MSTRLEKLNAFLMEHDFGGCTHACLDENPDEYMGEAKRALKYVRDHGLPLEEALALALDISFNYGTTYGPNGEEVKGTCRIRDNRFPQWLAPYSEEIREIEFDS